MIKNGSHKIFKVSDLCIKNPMTGFAAGQNKQAFNEAEGIPHIRPLNINSSGELHFEGTKYVLHEVVNKDSIINKNEVLFNNTNSMEWVGKSTVFNVDKFCACSNHITRLSIKKDTVIPFFLASLFNALRSLGLLGLLSTNFNNQAGINIETLSTLCLPIPDISQQKIITRELKVRKNKAKQLKQEAELEWSTAKTRFEQKLLEVV